MSKSIEQAVIYVYFNGTKKKERSVKSQQIKLPRILFSEFVNDREKHINEVITKIKSILQAEFKTFPEKLELKVNHHVFTPSEDGFHSDLWEPFGEKNERYRINLNDFTWVKL
jgi:hypothetical protein